MLYHLWQDAWWVLKIYVHWGYNVASTMVETGRKSRFLSKVPTKIYN
jgi:hypothetical protein